jgi:hypothetical protein
MDKDKKDLFIDVLWALGKTHADNAVDVIGSMILQPMSKHIVAHVNPQPRGGASRLFTARAFARVSPDGGFIDGPAPIGYAKFAIRKGMPGPDQKVMAVENPPHQVDDFDGEIKEGYGKGTKRLLWSGQAVLKVDGKIKLGKVNLHEHNADRAGLHYDFVAEGINPRTKQFEVNIPAGAYKGRYAFIRPKGFEGNVLITRMKDRGVIIPKPQFNLKDRAWLKELEGEPDVIVEWKPDGSLANIVIEKDRAIFRSHRDSGETYYDRLPAIEWLANKSRLASNRLMFPGPDQDGTVLRGELFHPEGAARVGGILNSGADKAIEYQNEHGPVRVYVWDIAKLKGKDVSNLPYSQRREMYKGVVNDIRRFNNNWEVVPGVSRDFVSWYDQIIGDKRGLPFAEGVVVKKAGSHSGEAWAKVKFRDTVDVRVIDILEGVGKREGKAGRLLVETAGGGRGEVGSFKATDEQLEWVWKNRDVLRGQVAEIVAQEITKTGAPRAGVFIRWHPSKSEAALLMYALDDRSAMFAMKSAAGWRRK